MVLVYSPCGVAPVLSSRPPILTRKPPSVLSPFAQLRCYLRWGDVISISSEGVTPQSSLVWAPVPLPVGSLLLRHLASFEESLQVVPSPCCPRELPDVISENLSLDAGSRTPAVPRRALTCFFRCVIGLLPGKMGSASRFAPQDDFSRAVFRGCRYSVMFRPPILLPPQIVRAYRASLPLHAPDMQPSEYRQLTAQGLSPCQI